MSTNWQMVEALASFGYMVTSVTAIGYAALQLRHEREYRAVTNLEKQLDFFHSDKFREARRRLARERLSENGQLLALNVEEPPVAAFEVLDFYEHLGLLVKKGHLEIYDVWHTFYERVQPVYADFRVMLEGRTGDWADEYRDLRHIMHGMDRLQQVRLRRRREDHAKLWTDERIGDHYAYELEATSDYVPRRRSRGLSRRRGQVPMAETPLPAPEHPVQVT